MDVLAQQTLMPAVRKDKGLICESLHSLLQLTVVHLVTHGMGLWRATLAQQKVQRCSTAVTLVWFQRGG